MKTTTFQKIWENTDTEKFESIRVTCIDNKSETLYLNKLNYDIDNEYLEYDDIKAGAILKFIPIESIIYFEFNMHINTDGTLYVNL